MTEQSHHNTNAGHGANDADHHGGADHHGPHGLHGEAPQVAHGEVANPTVLLVTFLVLTFGTVFVVLLLAVYHNTYKTNLIATTSEGWTEGAKSTFANRRGETIRLNSYGTVDAANGVYHIPIEAAAGLVVEEYSSMGRRGAADSQPSDADAVASTGVPVENADLGDHGS